MFIEVFHQAGGRETARWILQERSGKAFDPSVVDAFIAVSSSESFWRGLEQDDIAEAVLASEPQTPHWRISEEELDQVALALADFADLKSIHLASHSRPVADAAERMAVRLHLPKDEVTMIRRSALVHDIGLVSVPSFVLNKPEDSLGPAEREGVRLHPYYGERILAKVPALEPIAAIAGRHHERMDGKGYHRGLPGPSIPLGARIIAVADTYTNLVLGRSDEDILDPEQAIAVMHKDVDAGLYADAVQALADELEGVPHRRRSSEWPSGLTDREVEVLRLVCIGQSRKEMAKALFLSENTVRHHIEHIYDKIGVSSRAAAALFAMEHQLLLEQAPV
jgi:HD-GYP domain-containing protein (c-di-GMP phosphodiesterase class II)